MVEHKSFQKLKRLVEGMEAGHVPDVSRETPAPAYVEALSEAAGTLELMAMGLRQKVANLRDKLPVATGFVPKGPPDPPDLTGDGPSK
jgi:hypothetical protein